MTKSKDYLKVKELLQKFEDGDIGTGILVDELHELNPHEFPSAEYDFYYEWIEEALKKYTFYGNENIFSLTSSASILEAFDEDND